jgi:hypothetical protein
LNIRSFQAVTGPKTDLWLVQTVGVLVTVIGLTLCLATFRKSPNGPGPLSQGWMAEVWSSEFARKIREKSD